MYIIIIIIMIIIIMMMMMMMMMLMMMMLIRVFTMCSLFRGRFTLQHVSQVILHSI